MEAEETTVTGVIDQEPKLSQREQAMQSILAASRADVSAGTDTGEQDDTTVAATPEPEPEIITLKIDGTEIPTPKEKVIEAGVRALQKESAAEKRLWEASAREKALNTREEELRQMEQDLLKKRDQQPDQVGREFVDAVFSDPDTAASTITTLARQVQHISDKVARVEKTEVEKQESVKQSLVQHYHTNYQDIASDEVMNFALNKFRSEVAAENPNLTPIQVVDQAAERVYQKFGRTVAPGHEPTDAEKRKQAKEKMPAPVKQASARTPAPPEVKPKTLSEKIDEMRKGRGPSGKR